VVAIGIYLIELPSIGDFHQEEGKERLTKKTMEGKRYNILREELRGREMIVREIMRFQDDGGKKKRAQKG